MMQIFADVTGREIRISETTQAGAIGSAVYAAVAGGADSGIIEASAAMSRPFCKVYTPDRERHIKYSALYAEYKTLHDYFGRGENDIMKRLLDIKRQASKI